MRPCLNVWVKPSQIHGRSQGPRTEVSRVAYVSIRKVCSGNFIFIFFGLENVNISRPS